MPKEEDVIVVRKSDFPSFQKLCCFTNDYNATEVCQTPNRLAGKIEELYEQCPTINLTEIINKAKARFRCAACDGAKCGHTQGCRTLSNLLARVKGEEK